MLEIAKYKKSIDDLCIEYGIVRFEIFGSAFREDFAADGDVDCLIEFAQNSENYFEQYFNFKYSLEEVLGRQVDLAVANLFAILFSKRK